MDGSPTFEELVQRHERDVLRVCRSIVRDDHLSLDAAQETFVRLWSRMGDERAPEHLGGWLRKVALSTALDVVRRHPSAEDADLREAPGREATGDESAAQHELLRRYETALRALPEGQRTVFLLRHEGDLRLSEVAELLGVSLPTAKTQFARACVKLQASLRPFEPERGQR